MSRVRIGTINWEFKPWNDTYYPDDIPDDWKLAFYANDFSAVVLPENVWRTDAIEKVAENLEDLDAQFAVYCLLESGSLSTTETAGVKSLLKPHFRGFIVKQVQSVTENNSDADDCIYPTGYGAGNAKTRYWAEMPISTRLPLEVLFLSENPDLKKLRNDFEQVRQQLSRNKDVLVVVTPAASQLAPNVDFLQQLRTMLELMAIA